MTYSSNASPHVRDHDKALAVLAALLACVLALALIPRLPALADTQTGSLTVEAAAGNEDVSYAARKIFSGKDAKDSKLADIAWTKEAIRTSVVGAIKAFDPSYEDPADASESAQAAAEFIATHIGDTQGTSGGTFPSASDSVIADSESFAATLALAVSALEADAVFQAGEERAMEVGWWLVTTEPSSLENAQGSAGTAAIFTHVGTEKITIAEKASVPTVTKQVQENSTGTWGIAADASARQEVSYRIQGTLPSNLNAFDTYYYCFTDTLSKGLTLDESSIRVTCEDAGAGAAADASEAADSAAADASEAADSAAASASEAADASEGVDAASASVTAEAAAEASGASDISGAFTKEVSTNEDGATVLKVSIEDVRSIEGISAGSIICVSYTAALNEHATTGVEGNVNTVELSYSNNPGSSSHGTSIPAKTTTYSWQLNLHKQDKQNASRSLEGAKFTLRAAADTAYADVTGLYVQEDGSFGEAAWEFTTDAQGNLSVPRIDAGTYVLSETSAPQSTDGSSYEVLADTTIVIASNIPEIASDETQSASLEISASSDNSDVVVADSVDTSGVAQGSGIDVEAGIVTVVARDTKQTAMPKTGEIGAALAIGAGLACLIAGCVMLARRRRREKTLEDAR